MTNSEPVTMIEWALSYAKNGWLVLPLHHIHKGKCSCNKKDCHSPGKHPIYNGGKNIGTNDIRQVELWWTEHPEANIGLWCKNHIVVDVDPRHGGDKSLDELFNTLSDKYGFDTLTSLTGGGGKHYIFSNNGKLRIDCVPAPGVEIKTEGALIVLPPSRHVSGNRYEWEEPVVAPAEAPQWVIDLYKAPEPRQTANFTGVPRDMEEFVTRHGIKTKPPKPTRMALGGMQWDIVGGCPFQPDYDGGAPSVGVSAAGAAWFKCFCGDHGPKRWEDLRDLYEPRKTQRRGSIAVATEPSEPESEPSESDSEPEQAANFNEKDPRFYDEKVSCDWTDHLHRAPSKDPNKPGAIRPILLNAELALSKSPEWDGVLAYDEFLQRVRIVKHPPIDGPPWPRNWTDADDTRAALWMQQQGIYVGTDTVSQVVSVVARQNPTHAVRKYLNSLTWDGKPRIDTWLTRYLGVPSTSYTRAAGRMWLISAIARVMQPGCQVDHMLVLEGVQGLRKSTALKILASDDWFCDTSQDLHNKDAQIQLVGVWICEWGELGALKRNESESVKSFLTRRVEKYRPPYGRNTVEEPRQCVFAGTTNLDEWLKDDTGGRRFWPVKCYTIDIDGITKDRDQLWAEAFTRYTDGFPWWPDTDIMSEEFAREQADRMPIDMWHTKILEYTSLPIHHGKVTIGQILSECIDLHISKQTQNDKNRVGQTLRSMGWTYRKIRTGDSFWSGYVKGDE